MNLFRAFMELEQLTEAPQIEAYSDRFDLIAKIKAAGRNYKFDKYSDAQLFRIWQRMQNEPSKVTTYNLPELEERPECAECGAVLTDGGFCPRCDDGAEDF